MAVLNFIKKKKWIIPAIIVAALALIIYFGATSLRDSLRSNPDLQLRTWEVVRGDVDLSVAGSGSLQTDDSVIVEIPSILPVTEINVALGDIVKAGDVLATLDPVEMQNIILQVKDDIAAIDVQISDAKNNTKESRLTAPVAGRVKKISAVEGANLTDTMVQNGYLMILSLDGYMKVEIQSSEPPPIGAKVVVEMPDGKTESGRVVFSGSSGFTVTLTDNGPEPGLYVYVLDSDGRELGSGSLEINAPLNVVGSGGTIKSVNAKLNERVYLGQVLITLQDSVAEREYQLLVQNRISYEKLLRTLLKYAETGTVVSEIDGSVTELQGGQQSPVQGGIPQIDINDLMRNLPISTHGKDEVLAHTLIYTPDENEFTASAAPLAAAETDSDAGGPAGEEIQLFATEIIGTIPVPVTRPALGGTPQASIAPGVAPGPEYTGTISWDPPAVFFAPGTVYTAVIELTAPAGSFFSAGIQVAVDGAIIGGLSVSSEPEENKVSFRAVFPATESLPPGIDLQQYLNEILQSALSQSLGDAFGDLGNLGGTITIDGSSLFPSGSASGASNTALTTLCTISPGKEFSMVVDIDEIDIFSIVVGQDAKIIMDAMLDDVFTGIVTKVSTVGASQGGVTTYPVTIKLDISQTPLLGGMNATANIVTEVRKDVLLIPMNAVQEDGEETYVFLYDPAKAIDLRDNQPLGEIRFVETGISDGVYVEILSGLEEGEEIVYTVAGSNAFFDAMLAMGGGNRDRQNT